MIFSSPLVIAPLDPEEPAALQLYHRLSYGERPPFGAYGPDPLSVFMKKDSTGDPGEPAPLPLCQPPNLLAVQKFLRQYARFRVETVTPLLAEACRKRPWSI